MTWSGPIEGNWTATYGNDLRMSSLTVNDASTVSFTYDDDGALTTATGNKQTLSVERDPNTGFLSSAKLGTVSSAYAYNGFGELSSLSATFQGAVSFSQDLTRDSLGRITQVDETVGKTSRSTSYTYDAAGRLESVTRGADVTTYQYDDNGNRTAVLLNGVETIAASYDVQDRLESYGDFTFEQTDHGDLQRRSGPDGALELAYDGLGNLLSADVSSGKTSKNVSYTVDGYGRRVGKQIGGKFSRAWLYKDQLRPIAEITSAGEFSHFVYTSDAPGGAPDFMLRAGVPYRFVKDHLGSVRFVVNATTGVIAQLLEYDEFGNVTRDTLPGFQPFGFAGGLYDADTGLVRFGARDYDASVGRWLAKDPIGFEGEQANLYAYAGSDAINHADPSGKVAPAVVAVCALGGCEAAAAAVATAATYVAAVAVGAWAAFEAQEWFAHGRGNVADTGVARAAQDLVAAGAAASRCAALDVLMGAAKAAGNTEQQQKIKATQKAWGCRHSRSL